MNIKLIKILREKTGAGMLECKHALEVSSGSVEDAIVYLESNMKKEAQNTRIASKGLTRVVIHENDSILFEVNAETDFAAKNPHFLALLDDLSKVLIEGQVTYVKEALNLMVKTRSVEHEIERVSALMKEKLVLRRFHRIKKQTHQGFGTYTHQSGKLSVLVILDGAHDGVAKEIAMAVAAYSPSYIRRDTLDHDTLSYEMYRYEQQEHKDELFETYLADKLLYEKPSISNENQTIGQMLKEKNVVVLDFYRFELGQGIEDKLNCKIDLKKDGSVVHLVEKK